ncbi:MAG: hypothetical protein GY943_17740, partial [Chloroflexi bacterium]|nr:hypothetical protein [Chloroflexota bacterium]
MQRVMIVSAILAAALLTQCRSPQPIPPATTIPAAATPTPQIGISLATIAPPTAVLHQTTPTPLPTPTAT